MTKRQNNLVRTTESLIESVDDLRAALLLYKRACERLIKAGKLKDPSPSTIEQTQRMKLAENRQRVTAAIDDFEAARHQVRIALVAVALEEGSNRSDVARALGVSRQLTSRLALEID